jgi:hypothetical protein
VDQTDQPYTYTSDRSTQFTDFSGLAATADLAGPQTGYGLGAYENVIKSTLKGRFLSTIPSPN